MVPKTIWLKQPSQRILKKELFTNVLPFVTKAHNKSYFIFWNCKLKLFGLNLFLVWNIKGWTSGSNDMGWQKLGFVIIAQIL